MSFFPCFESNREKTMKHWGWALSGLFLLGIWVLGANRDEELQIRQGNFEKTLILTGELQAVDSFKIVVPQTSTGGPKVISELAPEGSRVERGEVVVRFDKQDLLSQQVERENKREEARTKIAETESQQKIEEIDALLNLAEAEKNLKVAELYARLDSQLIPRADFEEYQHNLDKARIEVEKAQERLRTLEEAGRSELAVARLELQDANLALDRLNNELQKMDVAAPIPGMLIHGNNFMRGGRIQVGDSLWSGMTVAYLPDLSRVEVRARAHAADLPRIRTGMPARIFFDALPGQRFRGEVVAVAAAATARNHRDRIKTFDVLVALNPGDSPINRPGMTARVELTYVEEDQLIIPRRALTVDAEGRPVILPAGKDVPVPVQLLDGNLEELVVATDLLPGTRIEAPSEKQSSEISRTEIDWLTVERQNLTFSISGTGQIAAEGSLGITPPAVPGMYNFNIVQLVPEGTEVSKGDLLVAFDPTEVQRQLREESSELGKVKEEKEKNQASLNLQLKDLTIQLEDARVQLEKARNKLRQSREFESSLKVQEARYETELAEKRVSLLERKLEATTANVALKLRVLDEKQGLHQERISRRQRALEALQVKAPTAGTVIYETNWRNEKKQVGSSVYRTEPVLSLPDFDTLIVSGQIAEVDAARLAVGQRVNVSIDGIPDEVFSGKIFEIGTLFRQASFDRSLKVLDLKVQLDKRDPRMRPGMACKLTIIVEDFKNVLAVPLSVIHQENGRSYVLVEAGEGWAKREVAVRQTNDVVAIIEDGLAAGERVAQTF